MTSEAVRSYYAGFDLREWTRLTSAEGAIEFAVNCHYIDAYLSTSATVLDIGGGPGRYTIWLAQRGHQVVLADLSPNLLTIAREQVALSGSSANVTEIVEADARDLSRWGTASFDAALSMGPFYHLPEYADRERAATELGRVLRPGGLAFVALMTRYTFLRRTIALRDENSHLAQPEFVARLLEDGVFTNDVPGRFTSGYGVQPAEVSPFFAQFGFDMIGLLSSEGLASGIEGHLAEMAEDDPDTYQKALELIIRTASDPSILGMGSHLLYIGKKAR
jgi:SAM-dependent methyltransferase